MKSIEITTKSVEETKKVGLALALTLEKNPITIGQAAVIAIEGDLGSGKTTFIQGIALGFKINENVLSPTFLILKQFGISGSKNYRNLYHIDAYRLKHSDELLELGFKDLLSDSENVIVIEWADKIKNILPRKIINIGFTNRGNENRKITLEMPDKT